MSQMLDSITAEQMVLLYQKAVEDRSAEDFAALFAEDAVMEFPFADPGWPSRFVGRDAIRSAISTQWDLHGSGRFHNFAWYETTKPGQIIVEYFLPRDDPWDQTALLILEVRNSRITLFRHFVNPAA